MSAASGMALSIRQAEESETFDLAGQNVETIKNTIKAAFSQPFPLKEMIRVTFVTGAGKQARQKYDEGAARAVTSTLRDLGYEEDRAASAVMDCAGSFKLQHDTGKNLKTVVVFPKTQAPSDGDTGERKSFQSLIPEGCPAHKIAMSSKTTFERMLHTQCPSWSQKKGCLAALEHLKGMVDEMDAKLMKGTPLDDPEQEFYDQVAALDDKISYTRDEMHKQVESGSITKFEKDTLLQHNADRLDTLDSEMTGAEGKKLEKLQAMKAKMAERRDLLQNIEPKQPHKLRHEAEIAKLWKEALPLLRQEEQTKGRLLSVKETQTMAKKDEIMSEIEHLEEASRGWFEDDEAFDARVAAIRENFKAKLNTQKAKGGGKKSGGSGAAVSSITGNTTTTVRKDKWVTPGESLKKNALGKSAAKKKKKGKGGGVFAAMMERDDSDSDEEDDNNDDAESEESDNEEAQLDKDAAQKKAFDSGKSGADGINQNPDSGKAKNSKKKKSKRGKKKEPDMSEDELLNSAAAANEAAKKEKMEALEASQTSNAVANFIRNFLIPFILAIITWIASLFVGKPKRKRKKD